MPAAQWKVCQSELSKHLITRPETQDRVLLSISKLFSVALELLQAVDSHREQSGCQATYINAEIELHIDKNDGL